jgi:hypothetical protein
MQTQALKAQGRAMGNQLFKDGETFMCQLCSFFELTLECYYYSNYIDFFHGRKISGSDSNQMFTQ